jgi:hypothetical protein
MIVLEDRRILAHDIDTAHMPGARVRLACDIAGIDQRTLQRWNAHDGQCEGDGRPGAVRPLPRHALSSTERAQLLEVANEARFAEVPPARIVPMLADEGVYLASESSFTRVLRAHGQNPHPKRAKAARKVRPPTTHIAMGPREVWCWDMTYLPATVLGWWFHLDLILNLYDLAPKNGRREVCYFRLCGGCMKAGIDRTYTPEFRDAALKQVMQGGRGISVMARSLEMLSKTLANWVYRARKGQAW